MNHETNFYAGGAGPEFDILDVSRLWGPFRPDTRIRLDCLPFHVEYPKLLGSSSTPAT